MPQKHRQFKKQKSLLTQKGVALDGVLFAG